MSKDNGGLCEFTIERGFDVLEKPFRFVDSKSHQPTIKIFLPACEPEDMVAFDVRDEIAELIRGLLAERAK